MTRTTPAAIVLCAMLCLAQTAIAEQAPTPPSAAPAAKEPSRQISALNGLRMDELLVAITAYRLRKASQGLCRATSPLTGLTLHDARQYAPRSRPDAIRLFDLGDGPGVMAIAPGSPASRAGLRDNDELLAANGRLLAPSAGRGQWSTASRNSLDAAWTILDEELAKGPVRLAVRRGGETLSLSLEPEMACGPEVALNVSSEMQAISNDRGIVVTTSLVEYAGDEDRFAIVLAHEMAHILLGHRVRNSVASTLAALGPGREERMRMEREADYVGLYLMARAGYDTAAAVAFMKDYTKKEVLSRYVGVDHPGSLERVANMRRTAAEIDAKRARGQPLVPDVAFPDR